MRPKLGFLRFHFLSLRFSSGCLPALLALSLFPLFPSIPARAADDKVTMLDYVAMDPAARKALRDGILTDEVARLSAVVGEKGAAPYLSCIDRYATDPADGGLSSWAASVDGYAAQMGKLKNLPPARGEVRPMALRFLRAIFDKCALPPPPES